MILIRAGYELIYEFPKPTPLILTLNIHYSRASDLARPDNLITIPAVPVTSYRLRVFVNDLEMGPQTAPRVAARMSVVGTMSAMTTRAG